MSKHTKAPWRVDHESGPGHSLTKLIDSDGEEITEGVSLADAARIVACVNALEGIELPEDFVRVTREFVPRLDATRVEIEALRSEAASCERRATKLESEIHFIAHTLSGLLGAS